MTTLTPPSFAPARPIGLIGVTVLLTLLGLGLRLFQLSGQSLWTDEISSIQVARAPLDRIYEQSTQINNSLPTYFLLLRGCLGSAATELEFRSRLPSALAGAASIPVFILLVWRWRRNWGTALAAGTLLAVNPLHLWYSQEVRAYAIMLFFGLLSLLGFELARQGRKPSAWLLYWGAGLGAMALHKTGLVFPVACLLGDVWRSVSTPEAVTRGTVSRILWRRMAVHAPLLLGMLAVMAVKSYPPGEGYRRASSILEVPYTLLTFLGGYSFGPSVSDIQSSGAWQALSQNRLQVAAAALALGAAGIACARRWRSLCFGPECLLLTLGIGMVAAYGLISGFPFNVRYTLPALLGFLALIAAAATGAEPDGRASRPEPPRETAAGARWPRCVLAAALAVALWADYQWFFQPAYRKSDARAVARWLGNHRTQVQSWTVLPGYLSQCVEWYLASAPEVRSRNQPALADQTTRFPPVPDALILGRRHHILRPDQLVGEYCAAAGTVETNRAIPGFEVYARRSGHKAESAAPASPPGK